MGRGGGYTETLSRYNYSEKSKANDGMKSIDRSIDPHSTKLICNAFTRLSPEFSKPNASVFGVWIECSTPS